MLNLYKEALGSLLTVLTRVMRLSGASYGVIPGYEALGSLLWVLFPGYEALGSLSGVIPGL